MPPAVKLVPISIVGGVFTWARTGHETDATNASLNIDGKTEATLALPIAESSIWDARVFYVQDGPDPVSFSIEPGVSHNLDEPHRSFHTKGRDHCNIVYEYALIKLDVPQSLWATINVEGDGIFCNWNYVYGADTYTVEFTDTGDFSDAESVVAGITSATIITGPGEWSVRVRAESPDYEASDWSEVAVVTIAEPEVVDPALVDLVSKLELALEAWRNDHNVIL